jgi:hypothetical protein
MRLLAFIIALLLLAGTVDPTRGWLIALAVVTGVAVFRPRPWNPFRLTPAVDVRLASFALAVLLLAGTIEPAREWLIGLSIVTGVAAFMPRIVAFDVFGERERRRWWMDCVPGVRTDWRREPASDRWGERAQRDWDRWNRREERRARRAMDRWGDDWP